MVQRMNALMDSGCSTALSRVFKSDLGYQGLVEMLHFLGKLKVYRVLCLVGPKAK